MLMELSSLFDEPQIPAGGPYGQSGFSARAHMLPFKHLKASLGGLCHFIDLKCLPGKDLPPTPPFLIPFPLCVFMHAKGLFPTSFHRFLTQTSALVSLTPH